jgi:hypothetical protein
MSNEEFIEHFGVKGMKWGVRKDRNRVYKQSQDHKRTRTLQQRHLSELTNKQLKEYVTRVEMERKYHQLNPGRLKRGENRIKYLMGTPIALATAYNLATSPAGKAAISLGSKALKLRSHGSLGYRGI